MNNWRTMIAEEMKNHGESFEDVISCTLSDAGLDAIFDDMYGSPAGEPFTLWAKSRVYFPVTYDGAEMVSSVSRFPDGKPTQHVGGY